MTTAFGPTQTEAIYPKGVERHWWPAARNRIIERGVRAAAGAERGPILEIGCGTGVVVDHLASRGWDITGCDLAPADPATARVASRLRLGVDAFDLPATVRDTVRGVLLLDVLEHLPEPMRFLERIAASFEGLRWIHITLPARQELWSNYDEFNGHFKRYARADAGQLAPPGFRVASSGYFFHALWIPARVLKLLGRDRQTRFHPPRGAAATTIHSALASLFSLEARLVPGAVWGSSLGVLLRADR